MKQEIKDYTCYYCYNIFHTTRGGFSNHLRYCEKNPLSLQNKLQSSNKQKEYKNKLKKLDELTKKEYVFYCKNCKKEYKLNLTDLEYNKHKYSNFCSKICSRQFASNSYSSKELKQAKCINCNDIIFIYKNASEKTCLCDKCKNEKLPTKKCIICGNEFKHKKNKCCSKECLQIYLKNKKQYLNIDTLHKFQEIGKKSAQIQRETRRSKNEIEFCKLCENYFNNVEHNNAIFNGWDADIIIHDIKVAVLWNGKWHYEQIMDNTSLKQIQNRDNIKIKEIKNYGYIPYIIKDLGKYNINFVKEKFNEFINYLQENNYIRTCSSDSQSS